MPPKTRIARLTSTVLDLMDAAQSAGHFKKVVALGGQVEADLPLIHGMDWQCVEHNWLELMSFAFASMGQLEVAFPYFERLVDMSDAVHEFRAQAVTLVNLGKASIMAKIESKHGTAEQMFEKVRNIGIAGGWLDLESNACEGLSSLALTDGRAMEAMELAQQACVAADLMLDADFGSDHTRANAAQSVLKCSDLTSPRFDENILKHYQVAAEKIFGEFDSIHLVDVHDKWALRHYAMLRKWECEEACYEVLKLAASPRMQQNGAAAMLAKNATATLEMVRAW